jgi:hypothetical protein
MQLTSVISHGTYTCATGTAREHMKRLKYLQKDNKRCGCEKAKNRS